jgi:hypothetical protein
MLLTVRAAGVAQLDATRVGDLLAARCSACGQRAPKDAHAVGFQHGRYRAKVKIRTNLKTSTPSSLH